MKYVLDASAAVCWVLPRPLTLKALAIRDDFVQHVHELIAPSHFPGEVASALTKAERQKLIAIGDAHSLLTRVLRTPPALHSYQAFLFRATDISSQTRAGFYDCLYVALAEQENCEMLTDDDKLIKNLQGRYLFVRPLATLP
jgi:predicted nucleic acid-binding protein